MGTPYVEGEETGQRRQFSLNHRIGQGKKVKHLGTTLSPKNGPVSIKAQPNVTFSKSFLIAYSSLPFS